MASCYEISDFHQENQVSPEKVNVKLVPYVFDSHGTKIILVFSFGYEVFVIFIQLLPKFLVVNLRYIFSPPKWSLPKHKRGLYIVILKYINK
jgi:hypothetical protein